MTGIKQTDPCPAAVSELHPVAVGNFLDAHTGPKNVGQGVPV